MNFTTLPIFTLLISLGSSQVLPVLNEVIPDNNLTGIEESHQMDLNNYFSTEEIDNQVVRFESNQTHDVTGFGTFIDIALFKNRTPGTRTNFLNYVNSGAYTDSVIHRSVPDFVIQGGAYTATSFPVTAIPTDPPIVNEPGISNTFGTVSMAKLGGDPDSATSQWFVSTADNSHILDPQNGGFTVFGRVTQDSMENALYYNNTTFFPRYNLGGAFNETPVSTSFINTGTNSIQPEDLITFPSVSLQPLPTGQAGTSTTLTYTVTNVSDTTLITNTSITGNTLNYTTEPTYYGTADITVQAEDSVGNIITDTFTVTNTASSDYATWRAANWTGTELTDDAISGTSADPSSSGSENLAKFALGLTKDDSVSGLVGLANSGTTSDLEIVFPLIKSNDVGYKIQRTSDLTTSPTSWADVAHTEDTPRVDNGNTSTVSATVPKPTAETKAFYRIIFLDQTN